MILTSLESETQEQARWCLRPQHAQCQWFDQLLRHEFASWEWHQAQQQRALSQLIQFAAHNVPYYQDLFRQLQLQPEDICTPQDLVKLPSLTKRHLQDQFQALQAGQLPPGEQQIGYTKSTGTTGEPTKVTSTRRTALMFTILKQREYRIFRWRPQGTSLRILGADDLIPLPDGSLNPLGNVIKSRSWRYAGRYFQTGPELGFNQGNSMTQQLQWLHEFNPQYVMSWSGILECLAHAADQTVGVPGLLSILAVSEQLTPFMRRRIESTFGVPVHQNYGLNEIGLVAFRCPAGRYHVHSEHCWVEIVDDAGQPCAPGETGQVWITGLSNFAMPLIRYEAGDLAIAIEGPCPCGRTLPSFGELMGRYRRHIDLPPGSYDAFSSVLKAFKRMPQELSVPLRQFQLHQNRNNHFQLRILAAKPLAESFFEHLHQAWQDDAPGEAAPLEIMQVQSFPESKGKHQNFTSDFFRQPDR